MAKVVNLGVLFSQRGSKVCCLQCLWPKDFANLQYRIGYQYQQISVGRIIGISVKAHIRSRFAALISSCPYRCITRGFRHDMVPQLMPLVALCGPPRRTKRLGTRLTDTSNKHFMASLVITYAFSRHDSVTVAPITCKILPCSPSTFSPKQRDFGSD